MQRSFHNQDSHEESSERNLMGDVTTKVNIWHSQSAVFQLDSSETNLLPKRANSEADIDDLISALVIKKTFPKMLSYFFNCWNQLYII